MRPDQETVNAFIGHCLALGLSPSTVAVYAQKVKRLFDFDPDWESQADKAVARWGEECFPDLGKRVIALAQAQAASRKWIQWRQGSDKTSEKPKGPSREAKAPLPPIARAIKAALKEAGERIDYEALSALPWNRIDLQRHPVTGASMLTLKWGDNQRIALTGSPQDLIPEGAALHPDTPICGGLSASALRYGD